MNQTQTEAASAEPTSPHASILLPILAFSAIAIGGVYYVKWHPYYDRVFVAAANHSIGKSLLSGNTVAGLHAGIAYSVIYIKDIWKALVVSLAIAAGVQVLLPRRVIASLFAGRRSKARATGAAIPSMMCTCCAAPITVGMIESRAEPAAAIAYWLANPVLNPATIVFIGFVLGWDWAALRLVLGAALVFVLSHVAGRMLPPGSRVTPPPGTDENIVPHGYLRAWIAAYWRLAIRLIPEYFVLVFALGAARAWLFPALTPTVGHAGWLPPLLAAAGTVFVIPTAGEVPIVQTLQHFGLGTAGAAALLMTLPAVSLPSLAMLSRAVPLRVLGVIALGTFGFGLVAAYSALVLGL